MVIVAPTARSATRGARTEAEGRWSGRRRYDGVQLTSVLGVEDEVPTVAACDVPISFSDASLPGGRRCSGAVVATSGRGERGVAGGAGCNGLGLRPFTAGSSFCQSGRQCRPTSIGRKVRAEVL